MKLVVITICKDEADTIGELLDRIPKKISGFSKIEVLVLSDGSTDSTAKIARKKGATRVVEGYRQKRLAHRFQEAIAIALDMDADVAVNIDGDLQFQPEDIPKLVRPILKEGADFVAADRFTDTKTGEKRRPQNMPVAKYYGNKVGVWLVSLLSGEKFRDVTCGFRAYNRSAMLALNINSTYTYTQESFQVMASKKMNVTTVPINVKYYTGRKSRVVTSVFSYMASSTINIVRYWRDFAPLRFFGILGLFPFIVGLASTVFVLAHWIMNGQFSPYKFLGIGGVYLLTLGIFFWALGLLADMFSRMLNNQEKILTAAKELKWPEKK